jgi:hypothetical protein
MSHLKGLRGRGQVRAKKMFIIIKLQKLQSCVILMVGKCLVKMAGKGEILAEVIRI